MTSIGIANLVEAANKSSHPKHRHAAIIFHKDQIVAIANNNSEEHAEHRAIKIAKILGYKSELTLLSIAITKKGELKLAKPCNKCMAKISREKINNVYYTTKQQTIVKLLEE